MNWPYLIAALFGLATVGAHVGLGTRHIAQALLASDDLAPIPKHTAPFCWLTVGLMSLALTIGFTYTAFNETETALGIAMTSLAAGTAALNVVVISYGNQRALELPQWIFFAAIAALGILGLAT